MTGFNQHETNPTIPDRKLHALSIELQHSREGPEKFPMKDKNKNPDLNLKHFIPKFDVTFTMITR